MQRHVELQKRMARLERAPGVAPLPPDALALRAALNDLPGDDEYGATVLERLRRLGPDNDLAVRLIAGLEQPETAES